MGIREAVRALKDSTTVNLAKVGTKCKGLAVAIVRATNHIEAPPKEHHVRRTSVLRPPKMDVAYCIHVLTKRLAKTSNWIVAVKVLIVIHRILREGDPTFRELLMNYSQRGRVLHLASFTDDSGRHAWDCSAWVCTYALFLEERIACLRILKYDTESERLTGATSDDLLEQLPALQQLLCRLVGCEPRGLACTNYLIQYALALVLKESFKIYCAINDGIINLVEVYFDMSKHNALKALGIYRRAGLQARSLADYYDFCKHLALGRNFQFPTLRQPPPSILSTMEEYVKEAPQTGSVSKKKLNSLEKDDKEKTSREAKEQLDLHKEEEATNELKEPESLIQDKTPLLISADDLLVFGLNYFDLKAAEIEESNVETVATTSNGNNPQFLSTGLSDLGGTGWAMALVSTPSNIINPGAESSGGGLNKSVLDSLYEEDAARRQPQMQNAGYGYGYGNGMAIQNPFEWQQDPFALPNNVAPQTNMQMAPLSQQPQIFQQQQIFPQQETFQQQQQMFQQPFLQYALQQHPQSMDMMYYESPSQYPQQQSLGVNPSNPFEDPSTNIPFLAMPQHPNPG